MKLKPLVFVALAFASATTSIALFTRPAEAFPKFWTQVKVAELSDQEYRSVCGNGNACFNRNLDKLCQDKSGQWDAFYRFDGVRRCWVRRLSF